MTIRVRDVVEMKERQEGITFAGATKVELIENRGYNEAIKEYGEKEIDLKKLSLKEGDIILCKTHEVARILSISKMPKNSPRIPIITVSDFDVEVLEVNVEKLKSLIHLYFPFPDVCHLKQPDFALQRQELAQDIASNLKGILKEKKI